MVKIQDNSIDLIITSPPYWQLKDYGVKNQIGFDDSYEEYINNLNLVWNECYRALKNGSRLCINIGDQFARATYYGRYKVIPIRTEIIKFCENRGFDYMGAIIWQKQTTKNTTGGASIMGSFPYPKNGIISLDYEFILIFKKLGSPDKPNPELKEQSKLSTEEWKKYFSGHWYFNGEKQDGHIAMFPVELPKRLIKMYSFVEDTILDPFLGSGTTTLAAKNLNINSIGYELNHDFIPIIKKKLNIYQEGIFPAEHKFIEQNTIDLNYQKEIDKLSYSFKDSQAFNKKIDPKKLQYGSIINKYSKPREVFYRVKDVSSSEHIILDNGLKIRLIGIKINEKYNEEAINFLQQKLKNQKIFLKYDSKKYDSDNNILGYVFLKNKTFINAHLIKSGLVDVDLTNNYKYQKRFIKYAS